MMISLLTVMLFDLIFTGVSFKELEDFRQIGEGMFSKVFKVTHRIDRQTYAMKRSHISIKKKKVQDQFSKEVKILSGLLHRNVVRYYTSFLDAKDRFCILMEFCEKDLARCFQCLSDMQNLIKPRSMAIFNDIILGLEYLHSEHIVHRDLKPGNILLCSVDNRCNAKIGDFGLSTYDDQSVMSYVGSPRYQAPEQPQGKYDCKVDMFSAGLILFELEKLDWEDPDDETGYWDKVLGGLRSDTAKQLELFGPFRSEIIKRLIISLLEQNPYVRLSATEVREELNNISKDERSFLPETKRSTNSGM